MAPSRKTGPRSFALSQSCSAARSRRVRMNSFGIDLRVTVTSSSTAVPGGWDPARPLRRPRGSGAGRGPAPRGSRRGRQTGAACASATSLAVSRDGRLDFTALERRLANPRAATAAPASFLGFDVLEDRTGLICTRCAVAQRWRRRPATNLQSRAMPRVFEVRCLFVHVGDLSAGDGAVALVGALLDSVAASRSAMARLAWWCWAAVLESPAVYCPSPRLVAVAATLSARGGQSATARHGRSRGRSAR
jgi:hypothetical protein